MIQRSFEDNNVTRDPTLRGAGRREVVIYGSLNIRYGNAVNDVTSPNTVFTVTTTVGF